MFYKKSATVPYNWSYYSMHSKMPLWVQLCTVHVPVYMLRTWMQVHSVSGCPWTYIDIEIKYYIPPLAIIHCQLMRSQKEVLRIMRFWCLNAPKAALLMTIRSQNPGALTYVGWSAPKDKREVYLEAYLLARKPQFANGSVQSMWKMCTE